MTARSPLQEMAGEMQAVSRSEHVAIRELAHLTKINLRGNPEEAAFREGVRKALQFDLPFTSCRCAYQDQFSALWLAPDEWLIVAPEDQAAQIIAALSEALSDQHVSIVDVSFARTVIELSGARARAVLEKYCALDLHPRSFTAGTVAGTILARCQVYLEQTDDHPIYRLYVQNSTTGHLARLLMDAMAEFTDR